LSGIFEQKTCLFAEGNIGRMRTLARFEPEGGFRFATYAMTADPATPKYALLALGRRKC
jgi:hypothetical protein